MESLIRIIAEVKLLSELNGRMTPVSTGYKPLFNFKGAKTMISGQINLINQESINPGEKANVLVFFNSGIISPDLFKVGNSFKISEGIHAVGEGRILEILNQK